MRRLIPLLLLALPFGPTPAQPPKVVTEAAPPVLPAGPVAGMAPGTICEGGSGELWMVVDPPQLGLGNPDHVFYGVREQPKRQYVWVRVDVAGWGVASYFLPGPVYVVDLRSGALFLVPPDEWVRPVADSRLTFRPGPVSEP
jgi:hypothetical protein